MKKVYYISSAYSDAYPENTRSSFKSYFYSHNLNYLPNEPLEVAIHAISFSNKREHGYQTSHGEVLGIKSDLSLPSISSGHYDEIMAIFAVSTEQNGKLIDINFENPIFYRSSKEQICNAKFEIINLNTKQAPNFSMASPTIIVVVVRSVIRKMKAPFQILLDSSCPISLSHYSDNSATNFCIQLPQRFEFRRKSWVVCLKSLAITGQFFSINNCHVQFGDKVTKLKEGYFPSLSFLISYLNNGMDGKIKFKYDKASNHVSVQLLQGKASDVKMSYNLCALLGFAHYQATPSFTSHGSRGDIGSWEKAEYHPDMFALYPDNLIITCDLVQSSILGGEKVQVLRYASNLANSCNGTIGEAQSINFYHNDFVKLEHRTFDTIRIKILDVTGKVIKTHPGVPTRMQLLFLDTA